jgi:hypothetical protein
VRLAFGRADREQRSILCAERRVLWSASIPRVLCPNSRGELRSLKAANKYLYEGRGYYRPQGDCIMFTPRRSGLLRRLPARHRAGSLAFWRAGNRARSRLSAGHIVALFAALIERGGAAGAPHETVDGGLPHSKA